MKNLTLGEFGNKADESWEGERRLKVEFVNEKISPDKDCCCWETTADNVFWRCRYPHRRGVGGLLEEK